MKTKYLSYDLRDGAPSAHLQFKTWTEILGCAWNEYMDRSCSGFPAGSHETEMRRLLRECKKRGEEVIAVAYHNFAVSVAVKSF